MSELADIDTAFYDQRRGDADKSLAVKFYLEPIQNEEKTLEEGRPIFEDREMVEIRVRGDRNNIVIRPVRPDDKKRFRNAYMAFKDEDQKLRSGTPLSQWPLMSRSFVEELKFLGFYTVEDIAEASEISLSKVNGLRNFQEKAKSFLEFAAGGSPVTKLEARLDELQSNLEAALQQNARLNAALEEKSKTAPEGARPAAPQVTPVARKG
jgi:hypothetical protein